MNYDRLGYISSRGHEILSIRVRLTKSKWITISNFYIPPPDSKGQIIEFDTSLIPFSAASLICGDFNAHHPSWGGIQPEDARSVATLEWACANDLSILNDPDSPTRHNRATGNGSSPDLTVVGGNWSEKSVWTVDEEEIGGSDHLPIIITVHASINHQPVTSAKQRWRTNGINWVNFRNQVEDSVKKMPTPASLIQRAKALTDTIIEAAKKHVRKIKPGKAKNAQMTPKVRGLIKKRNALRKSISTKRKEWLEACVEVSTAK